jgi:rhodanese-related sulfurtransferase
VQDMKRALDDPNLGIQVIDVREPGEHRIARVEGVPLMPMSVMGERFTELDPEKPYYFCCKVGARSLHLVHYLREQGFKDVRSVKGGIQAWSEEIDERVPRY